MTYYALFLSLYFMIDYNPTLMVAILRKEYPEIAAVISARIKKSLPEESLSDLAYMPMIVDSFKKEKGITESVWVKGTACNCKNIVDQRELLMAVVMLFYHPEKLLKLSTGNAKHNMVKTLCEIIGTSREIMSKSASNAIVSFRAYEAFRTEVYQLYELIKIENQFFK